MLLRCLRHSGAPEHCLGVNSSFLPVITCSLMPNNGTCESAAAEPRGTGATDGVAMETDREQKQQGASANGSAVSRCSPRPSPISSMSLYERQAVQALQALQKTPNAAQYFQQLMLQQQSNSTAHLAVRQVKVNRTLRTPLIFMPSSTTTAAVATVTQQQQEVAPLSASSSQSENQTVQNLTVRGASTPKAVGVALRGVSTPKAVGVKTEAPELMDSGPSALVQVSHQAASQAPPKPSPSHIKIPIYPQPTILKPHPLSSGSASSIPLSQLLLHSPRALKANTTAPSSAHILVQASNSASQPHSYPVGTATIRPLVVQPLQKASAHGPGPLPLQGLHLKLPSRNLPPILPAPPSFSSSAPPHPSLHIPVQMVGARQSTLGNGQVLALAHGNRDNTSTLSSSSTLLTMVGGGVVDQGVGLKTPQSPQEGPPLVQVSQVASSPAPPQPPTISTPPPSLAGSSLSLPLGPNEQQAVTTNKDAPGSPTPQVKSFSNTLKRKSGSNFTNEEDARPPTHLQPIRDQPSVLVTTPTKTGYASPSTSSSPSTPPVLAVCSGGRSQVDRAPPPQAVVKPHVLTHLIEGFVIQEGAEPFPVCSPVKDPPTEELKNDSPDAKQPEAVAMATSEYLLKCEYCQSFAPAAQFRGTKCFCSTTCAKSFRFPLRHRQTQHRCSQDQAHMTNMEQKGGVAFHRGHMSHSDEEGGVTHRKVPRRTSSEIASVKLTGRLKCHSDSSHSEEDFSAEGADEDDPTSLSPSSSCHQAPPPPPSTEGSAPSCLSTSPTHWSVEEVFQFITSLQGCAEAAPQFQSQQIDGQALLLLKEEHLICTMNMKLGPALKICNYINNLKD